MSGDNNGGGQQNGSGSGGGQNGGGQQNSGGQNNGGGQGGGGQSQPWYASHNFDAETQAWIEERHFPDLNETLKAGREGSKLARDRNVIAKPDPKNIKEWTGFNELGFIPDKEKYTAAVNKPKLEDGEQFDDATFSAFTQAAHKAKLLPWQAEAVYTEMHALERQQQKDAATRGTAAKRELDGKLRTEWGPDYDTKMEGAKRTFSWLSQKFGGDFSPQEIEAAMGSPRTAKLFAGLYSLIGEDQMPGAGSGGGFQQTETVAGLQAELNRLWEDPEWKKAFHDPQNARHKDVKAQRANLLERKAKLELKASGKAA